MKIYQKLLKIQMEVKGLKKDKKSNNYEYVTGNKLLSFIKPLMDENQLILKQEVLSIDNERIDYKTGIGTSYEKPKSEILTKVMMRFTWIDCETGEKDENLFGANGQNEWEKGLGSALTYAERYFLLKFFHISTDEDDIDNPERKTEDQTPTVLPSLNRMNGKDLSRDWNRALATLKDGKDITYLRTKFKISKENEQLLIIESKK
jgi:hypothetical protein